MKRVNEMSASLCALVPVSWLAAMLASLGLLAPRNATAPAPLQIGAFAVSTPIDLIEERRRPLDGVIALFSGPTRNALAVRWK